MNTDSYKTISATAEGYFKDKGSKFYAFAYPIKSEEEIKQRVEELKKQFHDARHHCYAFRRGPQGEHIRANDDGEPSGSAGLPILNQIKSSELTNILVVVVRYFGGTLLGVPGLINAYKTSTQLAIEAATVIENTVDDIVKLDFEYPALNDVMKIVKAENLAEHEHSYQMNCSLTVAIRQSRTAELLARFEKIDTLQYNIIDIQY